MKVEDLEQEVHRRQVRVSAKVTWEDCDLPPRELYFDTDVQFSEDFRPNPDAFLLATFMPAMRHGERRVLVKGKICPQLRNGLFTVMQQLCHWYGKFRHRPLVLEATGGFAPPLAGCPQRTASFLSGGVDAIATLRSNRLDFPLDHPGSIQDCLFVHGFDIGGYEALDDNRSNSEHALSRLATLAKSAESTLIPVFTNLRHLDDDDDFFAREFYGAALASVAHTLSSRVSQVLIASGSALADLEPFGSHPLLDPNYSSTSLSVRHDGIRLRRLEKVGLIAQWEPALQSLRACFDAFRPANKLNCGRCEKCIRTMTELLVHGKLQQCATYPLDDISADLLRTIQPVLSTEDAAGRRHGLESAYLALGEANVYYWRELMDPLSRMGRVDLVEVIQDLLDQFRRFRTRIESKRRLARFDSRYLGSSLQRINRWLKRVGA